MKTALSVTGRRCLAVLFVLGSIVALGCSGSPPDDDDDDDDDEIGGSGGTGGLGGSGGTSSAFQTCYDVCQNFLDCPNSTPIDCVASCMDSVNGPCALQEQRLYECLNMLNVCTDPTTPCTDEFEVYDACFCAANPSSTACL